MSEIDEIIEFILNPTFTGWLLIVKILFMVFSLILLGFIIFALIKSNWLKRMIIWDLQEFLTYRPFGLRRIEKQWQKIKRKLESETESEWKLAIIEADKLTDGILTRLGFDGASLGERLEKVTPTLLSNVEEVKEAHKIRNNIIHDPAYKLPLEQAKKALAIYEKALTNLHGL